MERTHWTLSRQAGWYLCWVVLGLGPATLRSQPPITLETVIKAWKDRETRIQSARIEWTERETIPKGYKSNFLIGAGYKAEQLEEMGIRPGTDVPPQDVTFDLASSISLDGEKVRFERDDHQWSGKDNAYVARPVVSVFDGKLGKDLHPKGGTASDYPQAKIQLGSTGWMDGPYFQPVMLAYRPFLRRLSPFSPDTLVLTGRKTVIEGKTCLELEGQGRNIIRRVWVDPAWDYSIVRFVFMANERISSKVDIGYRKGPDGECLLDRWERVRFDRNGKMEIADRARVTRCEINTTFTPAEFDVTFPPGTFVTDMSNPGDLQTYIVKEGGWKRVVQPDERTASYEDLMKTPSGALGKNKGLFPSWSVFAISCVTLAAAGLLVWRRVASRKRPR